MKNPGKKGRWCPEEYECICGCSPSLADLLRQVDVVNQLHPERDIPSKGQLGLHPLSSLRSSTKISSCLLQI